MDNTMQNNNDIAGGSVGEVIRMLGVQSMIIPADCAQAVIAAFEGRAAEEGWIGIVTDHSVTPSYDAEPERLHTFLEAADHLGIREDDLMALLPDIAIAVESPAILGLTEAHMELLEQLVGNVRQFAGESMYRGGDL